MGAQWRETTTRSSKFATQRLRDRWLGDLARRQHHLLSIDQYRYAGVSESTVRSRVASGRLHRVRRGVYGTTPPPFSVLQLRMAAVLAGGPGALLSDWPAAEHQQIAPPDRPPSPALHIVVPGEGGRTKKNGLVIHRRGPVDPRDRRTVDGIPVTSADLTLVHLAPQVDDIELEQMLVAADSLRILKRPRLHELLEARHGRPGIARLRSLLALPPAEANSRAELYLIPLYREARLPRPEFNYPIAVPGRAKPLVVDLAWPEIRLVFELDTQRFHGDWERAEEDRERDQLLGLASWLCHRFVRRQLRERLAETAARASRLHALRAATFAPAA